MDKDIPAVMEGDPAHLCQVLVNLIGMSFSSPFTQMPKHSFIVCLLIAGQARPYQLASLCLVYIYVVFS